MRKNLITIILAIALFVIGFLIADDFIFWTLPQKSGLQYQVNTFAGQFKEMIGFPLILALLPISIAILWKHAPILNIQRRILTILIIILSICIFGFIRYQRVASEVALLQQFSLQSIEGIPFQTSIQLERFSLTTYMFFGLIAGSIISYFLLREPKIPRQ